MRGGEGAQTEQQVCRSERTIGLNAKLLSLDALRVKKKTFNVLSIKAYSEFLIFLLANISLNGFSLSECPCGFLLVSVQFLLNMKTN